ncbi:MAG: ketopantoate reductase family protein [Sphaerochaeta sp.]|nr:ketopantoate reductase family protein [Sphaerochaeta sp.]
MKNITLIGCGAVGALYGLRLHNLLGREQVCFLVDEKRKKRYEREGIFLNGQRTPFRYCTPEEAKPADLIILATKNHHLEDAIGLMRSSVGPDTAILSLLNGIESEQILAAEFGQEKVLYSFAVGLNSTHTGNAITYTAEGRIVFGEKDNKVSRRVTAIADLFEKAGISYLIPEDIQLEMWNKFMLNTTYNTISSLLYATYADFDQSAVLELAHLICREVQMVAAKEGVLLPDSLIEQNHRIVCSLGSEGKTSMCQDMEAGRKTENAWFCGTVIKLGEKHGIATPTCKALSLLVQAKEHMQLNGQVRQGH